MSIQETLGMTQQELERTKTVYTIFHTTLGEKPLIGIQFGITNGTANKCVQHQIWYDISKPNHAWEDRTEV